MANPSGFYQKFIILASPRTGSNYLSYFLHDHPSIVSIGEVFNIETMWGQPGKPSYNHSFALRTLRNINPVWYLKRYIFHDYPDTVRAVGFRLFYHHADYFSALRSYLIALPDLKVIHLRRTNLLDSLVSFELAKKTNHWSSTQKPEKKRITIRLSYDECLEYFVGMTKVRDQYERIFSNKSILPVTYERLYANSHKELEKIQSFLGVSHRRLSHSTYKQNTRPLSEVIENIDELRRHFRNTRWRGFFKFRDSVKA